MNEDTRTRVLKAELSLNKYDGVWKSELPLRQKIRFLMSHVLPTFVYGQECGNHTQRELSQIAVFLNVCFSACIKNIMHGPYKLCINSYNLTASAIWGPNKSRFPGPNPLTLALIMDLHA
jgi:hypothetical protein